MIWKMILYFFGAIAIVMITGLILFNMAGKNAGGYVGEFRPDLSQIEDGVYEGEYSFILDRLGAKISFEIKNSQLLHYKFEKLYGTIGYWAAEGIKLQMDQRDDLDFDVVSGATVSCNLARAAIKKALENGPQK